MEKEKGCCSVDSLFEAKRMAEQLGFEHHILDIREQFRKKDHRPYVVGFAAETNNVEEYARQKRIRKNLDLICANDVSQPTQGFNSDNNALHLFWQDGDKVLPLERKALLGQLLLDEIVTRYDEKNRR